MSLRYQTSLVERKCLDKYYKVCGALICLQTQHIIESDSLDDNWFLGNVENGIEPFHIVAICQTITYDSYIHAPLLDPTINFDYGDSKLIADLNDSVCISDFRFCKDHLQKIANLLWPLMNVYLLGEKDDIEVENGYQTTYETGFLIVLYRMSYPRCV
jgi:hypothetical protein